LRLSQNVRDSVHQGWGERRWDADERGLGEDVLAALIAGPLLEFGQPVAIPIQLTRPDEAREG
jgi:hypothetical protein